MKKELQEEKKQEFESQNIKERLYFPLWNLCQVFSIPLIVKICDFDLIVMMEKNYLEDWLVLRTTLFPRRGLWLRWFLFLDKTKSTFYLVCCSSLLIYLQGPVLGVWSIAIPFLIGFVVFACISSPV